MSIEEAKALYPGRNDWQFNPISGISIGDRVCWLDYYKERQEGTLVFYFQYHGRMPSQPDFKPDADFVCCRIHQDDGTKTWKKFWDISKVKPASNQEAIPEQHVQQEQHTQLALW